MEKSALFVEYTQEKNTLLTTDFLLSVDSHAFIGKYRFKIYPLLNALQDAYDYFYKCRQKNHFVLYTTESQNFLIQSSLLQLQYCTGVLIPLLKEQALKYLQSYIEDPKIGLPIYEVWD
jgi:hypothetical protein